jgi:hypothetical protein
MLYSRGMHPVARVIKPQNKTLVHNNCQMRLFVFSSIFDVIEENTNKRICQLMRTKVLFCGLGILYFYPFSLSMYMKDKHCNHNTVSYLGTLKR